MEQSNQLSGKFIRMRCPGSFGPHEGQDLKAGEDSQQEGCLSAVHPLTQDILVLTAAVFLAQHFSLTTGPLKYTYQLLVT